MFHKIFVSRGSIVGSIGVIIGTFGFHEIMEKKGVERRLMTAGDKKSFLDSFKPLKEGDQGLDSIGLLYLKHLLEISFKFCFKCEMLIFSNISS